MTNSADSLSPLIQQAMAVSQSGDSAQALALLDQAVREQPTSGIPHFLLGSEYASLGQFDKAELALSNAVLLAPNLPVARYQLGLLQYSSGRAAAALVTWQPLLSLGEQSPMPHWVRGFGALTHDQFVEAKAHFEKGVQLNNENPPMSSDILKILQEIDAVLGSRSQAASQAPEEAVQLVEEGESSSHFLVSNYGRQGPLH